MKWRPEIRRGLWVGAALLLGLLLLDAGLIWRVTHGQINVWTFFSALVVLLSLPALAVIGYRIYDLSRLRYEFDRNQLTIVTAGARQIVPTWQIEQVIDGRGVDLVVHIRSLVWPGCFIGQGSIEGVGLTLFYGVEPPRQQVILVTPSLAYGLTVDDVENLRGVLAACQELGPSVEVQQTSERAAFVHWDIWRDRLAQGMLLSALVLNLALFGLLLLRYPHLPNLLPLHFDLTGVVDRISPRQEVFALPVIGLITLIVNGLLGGLLYRRERVVSYMAWGGGVLVQLLFLLGLWHIVV